MEIYTYTLDNGIISAPSHTRAPDHSQGLFLLLPVSLTYMFELMSRLFTRGQSWHVALNTFLKV